ncbi:MAG TPA: hypothetical protein DD611_00240 [Alphaproteobacteria bacterium]|nr:hypothetical protein [Alphaproteobacteria bacterium]HBS76763.1 hypothetical protein [Alphaproteobacteria bacterium]
MKKLFLLIVILLCVSARAAVTTPPDTDAQCLPATVTTVACGAGYYLKNSRLGCARCPEIGKNSAGKVIYGTTPDKNTGGIESCYAPSGDYVDNTGGFTFTNQCQYSLN